LFHWEQRTEKHDAYILTLDLESVCLVVVGLGFRDYNTGMTHVKKKEQMMRVFQFLRSHLCDYEIPICCFFHHNYFIGDYVLDENSKPFDGLDCGSFARKTLRLAYLLEAKSIDCMASNPICYPYLQEMSPA